MVSSSWRFTIKRQRHFLFENHTTPHPNYALRSASIGSMRAVRTGQTSYRPSMRCMQHRLVAPSRLGTVECFVSRLHQFLLRRGLSRCDAGHTHTGRYVPE